jgi:hypothetical protein
VQVEDPAEMIPIAHRHVVGVAQSDPEPAQIARRPLPEIV